MKIWVRFEKVLFLFGLTTVLWYSFTITLIVVKSILLKAKNILDIAFCLVNPFLSRFLTWFAELKATDPQLFRVNLFMPRFPSSISYKFFFFFSSKQHTMALEGLQAIWLPLFSLIRNEGTLCKGRKTISNMVILISLLNSLVPTLCLHSTVYTLLLATSSCLGSCCFLHLQVIIPSFHIINLNHFFSPSCLSYPLISLLW